MIEFDRIATDDEQFKQVLRLRYELLDMPVGAPEISVPSENDNNPKNSNFVAIDSKQVVSAARLDRVTDTEFVVRRMVTSPEYQRKGIGRSIMLLMELFAKESSGELIRLNSTPYALPFYRSLGYHIAGNSVDWAGVRHPEMIKTI